MLKTNTYTSRLWVSNSQIYIIISREIKKTLNHDAERKRRIIKIFWEKSNGPYGWQHWELWKPLPLIICATWLRFTLSPGWLKERAGSSPQTLCAPAHWCHPDVCWGTWDWQLFPEWKLPPAKDLQTIISMDLLKSKVVCKASPLCPC